MTKLYLIALAMAFGGLLNAQDCPCCSINHQQFDFWIGSWEVVDTNGQALGVNNITKEEGGCVLAEQWTGASGGTGRSVNYFQVADSSWNQLWISANGFILELKGHWHEDQGAMILRSEQQMNRQGNRFYNQISWTPQPDGSVIQRWDLLDPENQILQTLFYGIYRKS